MPEAPAQSEASALRANLIFAGVAAITLGVLIAVVAPVELAWLQRAAFDGANARPTPEGRLAPL